MKRLFFTASAALAVAVCLAAASLSAISPAGAAQPSVAAQQPPTVVQQCTGDHPHYLFVAPTNRGYGQFVPAQAYAYGWFGVCSKSHAVFHWDYYDHRWIWW